MPREVILIPEALRDLHEAYLWYEEQRTGLGDDFLGCFEAALNEALKRPKLYPVRFDTFRRVLVRRFPYAIYFEHDEKTVFVHYEFHCSQHPARLSERLKEP